MKKQIGSLLAAVLLMSSTTALACVGKTLVIGTLGSPNEQLLAQMMAVMINERTGTTVNVQSFDDPQKLYAAVEKREINIIAENTARALQRLGKQGSGNADAVFAEVKDAYKKEYHLILLKPFGKTPAAGGSEAAIAAPAITEGILVDFPALPRVIEKLAGIAQDQGYPQLVSAVAAGDKPTKVARDFLKKKRFI